MNFKNFKWTAWMAKQCLALLLSLAPFLVAKVTNPAFAAWIASNAPVLLTMLIVGVTGVDANSLHTQNAIKENQKE